MPYTLQLTQSQSCRRQTAGKTARPSKRHLGTCGDAAIHSIIYLSETPETAARSQQPITITVKKPKEHVK